MTIHHTKIDGYDVTVDNDMGDGATGCWVGQCYQGDEYSASLAALADCGHLETGDGCLRVVREDVIDRITIYAESKGY